MHETIFSEEDGVVSPSRSRSRDTGASQRGAHSEATLVTRSSALSSQVDADRFVSFDPQRRAGTRPLKGILNALATFLLEREGNVRPRQRARAKIAHTRFLLAVEAIGCNLATLALGDGESVLAVPRSSDAMWATGRYAVPVYGQHFLDVLDLMAHSDIGLIDEVSRGHGSPAHKGRLSTIRPTALFFEHVPRANIRWDQFIRLDDGEPLVLRGRKSTQSGRAELIDYPETAATRRLRKQMAWVNDKLRNAPFWIEGEAQDLGLLDYAAPVDPTRRTLRRIFNNGSWYEGGRLYGGFWETMRREDRRLIRIATAEHPEGEPVVNVDYGQLFPRLAYVQARAEPPDGDLYAFGATDGWSREGCKKIVNALLLADKPLRKWPEGCLGHFPSGTKLADVVASAQLHHAPIANAFGSGRGLRLMRFESELLLHVLENLFTQGVTALPLHDSVLVGTSEIGKAETAMHAAFAEWAPGARAKLSAK